MELKSIKEVSINLRINGSNCTFMELKYLSGKHVTMRQMF